MQLAVTVVLRCVGGTERHCVVLSWTGGQGDMGTGETGDRGTGGKVGQGER